jgi:solute carrier family 15 (oligopeptide transporter), member 1
LKLIFNYSTFFSAILALYLNEKLRYDTAISTALYHLTECLYYFFSIFGAIIADSWWGNFKTLMTSTATYAVGAAIVTLASFDLSFLPIREISFVGLFGVMLGTGSGRSCQNVLGGDMFQTPEQIKSLDKFFSIQYIVLKLGQVSGMLVIPMLKKDVECIGDDDCYPLAFGTTTLLMIVALLILWMGKRSYVLNEPSGNMTVNVIKCIFVSRILTKLKSMFN